MNNKVYVGKSRNVENRWKQHRNIANDKSKYPKKYSAIHAAIAKHGVVNFSMRTLAVYKSESEASEAEVLLIAQLKLEGFELYNLTLGGDGASGYRHSEEAKHKMRLARIGKKFSAESIQRLAASQTGHTVSSASKQKMSISHLGMRSGMKGKSHTAEAKRKMSLAKRKKS